MAPAIATAANVAGTMTTSARWLQAVLLLLLLQEVPVQERRLAPVHALSMKHGPHLSPPPIHAKYCNSCSDRFGVLQMWLCASELINLCAILC